MPLWRKYCFELRQLKPSRFRRSSFPPITCLNLHWKAARKKVITRDTSFTWETDLHNRAALFSKHLSLPVKGLAPLGPQTQTGTPFRGFGCSVSLHYLAALWALLFLWGYCTCEIRFSPVNLSYANLIIGPAKECRRAYGKMFCPFRAMVLTVISGPIILHG